MTCQGPTLPPPREHRRQGRGEDGAAPHPHHRPGARFTPPSLREAAEPSSFMSGAAGPPLPRIPVFTEEPFPLVHIPTRTVFGTNAGALRFSLWSTLSLYHKQSGSGTSQTGLCPWVKFHGYRPRCFQLQAPPPCRLPGHHRPGQQSRSLQETSFGLKRDKFGASQAREKTGPAAKAAHCSRRDEPAQHAPQGTPEPHKSRVLLGITSVHTAGGQGGPGTGLMVKLLWPVRNAEITEGTGAAADVAATEEPGLAGGGPERPG